MRRFMVLAADYHDFKFIPRNPSKRQNPRKFRNMGRVAGRLYPMGGAGWEAEKEGEVTTRGGDRRMGRARHMHEWAENAMLFLATEGDFRIHFD